jgi:hypothetical protein
MYLFVILYPESMVRRDMTRHRDMAAGTARATSHPLDRVRMSECERRAAKAAMEQGERIADLLAGACAAAASIVHGIERGLRAMTRYPSR